MKRLVIFLSAVLLCANFMLAETKHVEKAPSLTLSAFGFEPGFLLGFDHTELIFSCALMSDEGFVFSEDYENDSQVIAVTPKVHVGYNFDGFDTGWNNSIGFAYASSIGFMENGIGNMEALAIYYKGEARLKAGFGIGFTAYLPMAYFIIDPEQTVFKTIGSTSGFWYCVGAGIATSSLNFRWYLK